jgi:hypothetical protein
MSRQANVENHCRSWLLLKQAALVPVREHIHFYDTGSQNSHNEWSNFLWGGADQQIDTKAGSFVLASNISQHIIATVQMSIQELNIYCLQGCLYFGGSFKVVDGEICFSALTLQNSSIFKLESKISSQIVDNEQRKDG